jgi:hypothetical protein
MYPRLRAFGDDDGADDLPAGGEPRGPVAPSASDATGWLWVGGRVADGFRLLQLAQRGEGASLTHLTRRPAGASGRRPN